MFVKKIGLSPTLAAGLLSCLFLPASACAQVSDDVPLQAETKAPSGASDSPGACDADSPLQAGDQIHAMIFEGELDMALAKYMIFERACDGVLMLSGGGARFPIAESWRLWEFEKAHWVDHKTAREIAVIASYATGMGPDGAKPFRAKIIMERTDSGWASSSTEILVTSDDNIDQGQNGGGIKPRPLDPLPDFERKRLNSEKAFVRTATTEAERQSLTEKVSSVLADVEVDFATERLVTATRMLTSGSIKMREIRVHKNDEGYDISYTLYRPRIGTADIKFSAIYVVLPNDGLPLNVFERGGKRGGAPKGQRMTAKSGVINRVR